MRTRWIKPFLEQFRKNGNVTVSANAVDIDRRTVYHRIDSDAEFKAAFESAGAEAADLLEEEARRRAHDGVDEPVFGRVGKDEDGRIGIVRKYSDTLLIFLLKGAPTKREKYRERQDLTSAGKAITGLGLSELTDDEIDRRLAEAEGRKAPQGVSSEP